MNRIPSREQVERLRQRYPTGTRIVLHSMDDAQARHLAPWVRLSMWMIWDNSESNGTTVPPCLLSPVKIPFQGLLTGKGKEKCSRDLER